MPSLPPTAEAFPQRDQPSSFTTSMEAAHSLDEAQHPGTRKGTAGTGISTLEGVGRVQRRMYRSWFSLVLSKRKPSGPIARYLDPVAERLGRISRDL